MADATQARQEHKKLQERIVGQWKDFSRTDAFQDLMQYIDQQREMYRKYAEERSMPHPNPEMGQVAIDNETVAALLQNSRGLNIVKTYLMSRVDNQVAPTSKTK